MKRKLGFTFYTLFFMAAILLEIYCFLELRKDIISVICGGCVVLIAGYLFLDTIRVEFLNQRERYYTKSLENEAKISQELFEMVKLQKAIYITSKRNSTTQENVKELLEGQIKAVKVLVKYNKANADSIILNSHQDITQLMKSLTLELAELNDEFKEDTSRSNIQLDRMLDMIGEGMLEINDRVDKLIQVSEKQIPKDNFKENSSVIHFERRENS